jgi:hypothetical protein
MVAGWAKNSVASRASPRDRLKIRTDFISLDQRLEGVMALKLALPVLGA